MKYRLLAPYVPTRDNPWDEKKAAHLCRRAGFGAPREELAAILEMGPEGAVERFLRGSPEKEEELDRLFQMTLQGLMSYNYGPSLQGWWLFRMQNTPFPLREKMTLFWHGHFATSYHKVEEMRLMHQQNETLRALALDDIRDLTVAISRDPAMIVWLDNEFNHQGNPNENFARELMELFTLGEGHYTEQDVREATRAFTGWHRQDMEFFFNAEAHDDGRKEILGRSGNFDGTDVVDILLQQPQAKRYLAEKILAFFVMPDPSEELVAEGAQLLTECNLQVRWFMRTLLMSQAFYAPEAYRAKIKSPVEFAVGAVRDLDAVVAGGEIAEFMQPMGQELFGPPSVKGWDGEEDWIGSGAWLARGNFAEHFSHAPEQGSLGSHLPLTKHVPIEENDPQTYVDYYVQRLLQGELSDETRAELTEYMIQWDEFDEPEAFQREPDVRHTKARGLIRLILSLPEYHLC